jgi:hypothetical protein
VLYTDGMEWDLLHVNCGNPEQACVAVQTCVPVVHACLNMWAHFMICAMLWSDVLLVFLIIFPSLNCPQDRAAFVQFKIALRHLAVLTSRRPDGRGLTDRNGGDASVQREEDLES